MIRFHLRLVKVIVQTLVYLFISLASLAIGAVAYFGLTFTPIESVLAGLTALGVLVIFMERTLRQRSERRLERAIEDLSRLLSTDAQAGQVLSQRINAIADIDAGGRIDVLEADISVLGTVVRQVAEAVAGVEDTLANGLPAPRAGSQEQPGQQAEDLEFRAFARETAEILSEPRISLDQVRRALANDKLTIHLQPILVMPRRRSFGFDVVPRLTLEDGSFADPPDYMPSRGGDAVVRQIEVRAFADALTVLARAFVLGEQMVIYAPVSGASLSELDAVESMIDQLQANRSVSKNFVMRMTEANYKRLDDAQRASLAALIDKGAGISLDEVKSLRLSFSDLADEGVTSVRVDAQQFIGSTSSLTDYHSADVAPYLKRFGIDLIGSGVDSEQQALTLIEDGVKFAMGPYLGAPMSVRPDLLEDTDDLVMAAIAGLNP